MTKNKSFKATVTRDCIVKAGTPVELVPAGHGTFLVYRANGQSTRPMTLWLRSDDFKRDAVLA